MATNPTIPSATRASTAARAGSTGIPKKIHYVWLGGKPLPAKAKSLIDGWKRVMPDHDVLEWNESNFDVRSHPWMARMYAEGRFAFASDYLRLKVLQEHGGLYLDTDMEVKKHLGPLLDARCLFSFEMDSFLATCIMACEPGHPVMADLLRKYDELSGVVVSNSLVTEHFLETYPDFHVDNREKVLGEGVRILPKEFCVVPTFTGKRNYAVHHAENQWKPGQRLRLGRVLRGVIGGALFYKLVNARMNMNSAYRRMDKARGKGMVKVPA